jgi:hypothetical protein
MALARIAAANESLDLVMNGPTIGLNEYRPGLLVDYPLHGADGGRDAGGIRWVEFEFRNFAVECGHRGLRLRELALQLIET